MPRKKKIPAPAPGDFLAQMNRALEEGYMKALDDVISETKSMSKPLAGTFAKVVNKLKQRRKQQ